jgi:ferric-dicitrate binding protein FerR (iron transport regulator)
VRHADRDSEWPDLDALWRLASVRAGLSEAGRLRRWLRRTPNAAHAERGLRAIGEEVGALASRYDVEAGVRRLRSAAGIEGEIADPRTTVPPNLVRLPRANRSGQGVVALWVRRVAAVAAMVTACVWGVERLTMYGGRPWGAQLVVESTRFGEVSRLRLPDHSDVVLGPETTMRYRVDPRRGAREVWLEGEAKFAVAAAPGRPFRVYAAHSTAEDIGTTFTVRAYRADSVVRVVVLEGAVVLRARTALRRHARTLRAGELGQLARNGDVRGERVDAQLYMAWTRDTLAFKNTPLLDVANQLKRWYGVDVTVEPAIAARTLTGSFAFGSLPTTLAAIAAATDARHDRRAGRVVLAPR